MLKYAMKMMTSEMTMDRGMFFLGFLASSPVVATQSKPTKPKKHLDAPAMTPAIPKGRKPPDPATGLYSSGISSSEMYQFLISAVKGMISIIVITWL